MEPRIASDFVVMVHFRDEIGIDDANDLPKTNHFP